MLYDIGFLIFSIIYLPVLILKGKLHGEFPERFGRYVPAKERALLSGKDRIWIQAVSVGEVAVCKSLIPLLKNNFPGHDLVISTITKAGNDLAKRLFSKDAVIIYFPLDFGFTVRRAVKYIKPRMYIMVETEIWPNLLSELSANSVPSIMINGRISDRSIGKYRLIKPFLKNVLSRICAFCMQDAVDAERIIELGAPVGRVSVTKNMKFDAEIAANLRPADSMRELLGLKPGEDLIVAGSVHIGEEVMVMEAFARLSKEFPNLKLLIAPRHVGNFPHTESIIKEFGFEPSLFSELKKGERPSRVIILNTIGQLNDAYAVATIVFIGGSLVRHGGQNPIEPAIFAKPILFGPHMFNFKYIADVFLKEKGAIQIFNVEDLVKKCKFLLSDANARAVLGENAKRAVLANRGATKKNLEKISEILR